MSHDTQYHARSIADAADSTGGASGGWRHCLVFRLRKEEYAIDLLHVREIRNYELPGWMAGYPDYFSGVLSIRGEVVPILDLRARFGLEAKVDGTTVTVVVKTGSRTTGIVVDAVSDVVELAAGQIRPAPDFEGGVDSRFVTHLGLVRTGERDRLLVLLDIDLLLASVGGVPAGDAN